MNLKDKKQEEIEKLLADRKILVVIEDGKAEVFFNNIDSPVAIYYMDEDRLEKPSVTPSFRSFKSILKNKLGL